MKLYVAGRFQSYAKVRGVIDRLQALGHTITYDWTRSPEFTAEGEPIQTDSHSLPRPVLSRYAQLDRKGVRDADAIVVCADDSLAGAYIEMGMALEQGKTAYVIACERWTIFLELPEVKVFESYSDFFTHIEVVSRKDWLR